MARFAMFSAFLGVACGRSSSGPSEPALLNLSGAEAALTANQVIDLHLDDLARAIKAMNGTSLIDRLFPSDQGGCPEVSPGVPDPGCEPPAAPLDMTGSVDDIEKELADRVFNVANLEPDGPGADARHVVFRLRPELVCPKSQNNAGAEVPDATCAKMLTDVPVRLTVTSAVAGNVDVAVSVGTTRPVELSLHQDAARIRVSLTEARAAEQALSAAAGEQVMFPDTLEGTVGVNVSRLGAQDYQAEVFGEGLRYVNKSPGHREFLQFAMPQRATLLSAHVDGTGRTVAAGISLPAGDLTAALDLVWPRSAREECAGMDPMDPSQPPTCTTIEPAPRAGALLAHLGGLNVQASLDAASDTFRITGLGLGNETTWVKYEGQQVLSVDMNADLGRQTAMSMTDAESGGQMTMNPGLVLRLTHDFTTMLSQFDDAPPDWLRTGSELVSLTGASGATIAEVQNESAPVTCDDQGVCSEPSDSPSKMFRVVAGTLRLEAQNMTPVVVESGRCLVSGSSESESGHPFSAFASGVCE